MAAALNESPPSPANGLIWAMERFAIRNADALLWPGGDVVERYRAFYGQVATPLELALPVWLGDLSPPAATKPPSGDQLRLLFLNRLERRKGVLELVEAVLESTVDVRLTIVGGDTSTAPGGTSMRDHLEQLIDGDERVELKQRVAHEEVPALIAAHHVVALPVRWETFSYVAREALAAGRPVLATPSGAIPDVVKPGVSGWLSRDLGAALESLDVAAAEALREGTARTLEQSVPDASAYANAYSELTRSWHPPRETQVVDALVAVGAGDVEVELTLRSLAAQRGVRVRVTLLVEPSALPRVSGTLHACDPVLADGGRIAMWRAGADVTDAESLLLVPAGAELDPEFARRALEALGEEFDYATAFVARGRAPWHAPIGGEAVEASGIDAGASVALARRHVLEREAATERELWSGLSGVVMHEPLVRRLPRHAPDPADPAEGGAPSAAAVAAAFGDVLRVGAAA
jgi:hypothetical protein